VPFKSEKQRRYLWANEPEIARDWTDTYGSRIQKNEGGIIQGGVKNYLGKQPEVLAPRKWQSGPDKPPTELAYITEAEKDLILKKDIHGSLKKGPNMGPSGIMSLDSWGDAGGGGQSGADYDADPGGAGSFTGKTTPSGADWKGPTPELPPHLKGKDKTDIKSLDDEKQAKKETKEFLKKQKKGSWLENINTKSRDKRTTYYQKRALDKIRNKLKLAGVDISGINSIQDIQNWLEGDFTGEEFATTFKDLGYKDPASFDKYNHEMWNKLTGETGYIPTSPSSFKHPLLDKMGFYKKGISLDEIQRDIDRANFIGTEEDLAMNWVDRMKLHSPQQYASYMGGMDYNPRTGVFTERGGGDGQQQPNYMNDPAYQAWLKSQQGGTGGEEVVEESGGGGGVASTVYPYQFYGQPDYPTSATFKSYLARGGRVPAAFGGIMDTNTGRRAYGLGSIFKSVGKAVKGVAKAAGKVLKSPVGMALLGYGAYKFGPQILSGKGFGLGSVKNWGDLVWKGGKAAGQNVNLGRLGMGLMSLPFVPGINEAKQDTLPGMADRGGRLINPLTQKEDTPQGIRTSLNAAIEEAGDDPVKIAAINEAYPFLNLGIPYPYENYAVAKDGGRIGFAAGGMDFYTDEEGNYREGAFKEKAKEIGGSYGRIGAQEGGIMMAGGVEMDSNNEIMERIIDDLMEADPSLSIEEAIEEAKKIFDQMASRPMPQPNRIMAQEGGLMDLGGMEKDYRNNGGFVAIGGEERADDVPARLSRNEFVFTADAVRGAGGGDIDKGAEIMENVMKNLEQGGKISQESQGNTGAQEMFSVSERIGEVL
jgi:hypothetical protein